MKMFENIKDSWVLVSLGEITSSFLYGLSEKATSNKNGIPFIRITDINENGKLNVNNTKYISSDITNVTNFQLEKGDLLIARSGSSVGINYLHKTNDSPAVFASYLIRFRLNQKLVLPEYLSYYFRSPMYWNYIERVSRGATILNINSKQLLKLPIPLPTLLEQSAIVEILKEAESLKETKKIINEKYNKLKASVFYKLFGEPSKNEKKWMTILLGKVLSETPKDGPHESPNYVEQDKNGIPFLSTRNIKPGKVIWKNLKYISHSDAKKYWRKTKPEFGDILYTKGGTTGHAKVIDFSAEIAIWVHLALLKPDRSKVNSVWLEQMLNTSYSYFQSQKLTRGATNKDLGLQRMVKIKIILPPLELQEKFANLVTTIDVVSNKQETSMSNIVELNKNLLIQAFNGELTDSFRQKEQSVISSQAKFRDETLKIKLASNSDIQSEKTVELSKNNNLYLSDVQQELLNNLEITDGYVLVGNDFNKLNIPPNQIQRNLDLLTEIGMVKAVNIAIAPGEVGNVFYTPAYRSLTEEDNTREADLESLEKETNI